MIEQQNTLAEKFLKKGFWLYFFSLIIGPIGYIIKVIVSNDLTVSEIGIIYGILSFFLLLSSFNDIGMAESLNKFIPHYATEKRYDKVKTIFFYAIFAQAITGGILFLFIFFGADIIGNSYFKNPDSIPILKILGFYFLFINFMQVIGTFFQAIQDTFSNRIIEMIRLLFTLLFTAYFYFSGTGNIENYSMSWVIGLLIGMLFTIFIFYRKYYKTYLKNEKLFLNKAFFKKIITYSFLVFLGSQAGTILSQIDMQMIILFLGTEDTGYYSNYLSIISIPFLIIGPIFGLLFPVFSEMVAKKEFSKISLIKSVFLKNFFVFSFVFSILFFVFGPIIAYILFGEKFIPSGIILRYAVFFICFNFLLQINFSILAANGKLKERINIVLITIFVNIILTYIFIQILGVNGAALATGLGWILMFVLSERKLKEYTVKIDIKYIVRNILIFATIGLLLFFSILPYMNQVQNRFALFFYLAGISFIYFIIYIGINYKDFKYLFYEVKKIKK